MYLTRMYLNPERPATRRLMGSRGRLHAQILNTTGPVRPQRHPLWRMDTAMTGDAHCHVLYIVGETQPDMAAFEENFGWTEHPPVTVDYRPRLDTIDTDQTWAFRLTANPTHNAWVNDKVRRIPHTTRQEKVKWLDRRAAHSGFTVVGEPSATPLAWHRFVKSGNGQEHTVTVASTTFDGFLTVTDPDAFRSALTEGIGRAKAYGCGLMTVAPPR